MPRLRYKYRNLDYKSLFGIYETVILKISLAYTVPTFLIGKRDDSGPILMHSVSLSGRLISSHP